jgi:hypothetical protein
MAATVANKLFAAAFADGDDVLALPDRDLDQTVDWDRQHFDMNEVERRSEPVPTEIMERDGVKIGCALNGGDACHERAAILVTEIHRARRELEENDNSISNWRVNESDGEKRRFSSSQHRMDYVTTSSSRSPPDVRLTYSPPPDGPGFYRPKFL